MDVYVESFRNLLPEQKSIYDHVILRAIFGVSCI